MQMVAEARASRAPGRGAPREDRTGAAQLSEATQRCEVLAAELGTRRRSSTSASSRSAASTSRRCSRRRASSCSPRTPRRPAWRSARRASARRTPGSVRRECAAWPMSGRVTARAGARDGGEIGAARAARRRRGQSEQPRHHRHALRTAGRGMPAPGGATPSAQRRQLRTISPSCSSLSARAPPRPRAILRRRPERPRHHDAPPPFTPPFTPPTAAAAQAASTPAPRRARFGVPSQTPLEAPARAILERPRLNSHWIMAPSSGGSDAGA